MIKKFTAILLIFLLLSTMPIYSTEELVTGEIYEGTQSVIYRNVTMYAPAVATTDSGYVGVISTVSVTIQNNGSGRVFVDTLPLTQVDMQGSARLAVKVASTLVQNDETCKVDPNNFDYFFVVRTSAPVIGGPSAGGIMTVATVSLLENWNIDNKTVMTGMINPDGSIGPIGGITHKIDAANSVGAERFLVPSGQMTYTEMVAETETQGIWKRTVTKPVTRNVAEYAMDNYGMEVNEIEDINDALEYFTGHRFDIYGSNESISTVDYNTSMKPLAEMLLDESSNSLNKVKEEFEETNIPNYPPERYRDYIEEEIDNAEKTLEGANKWYDENLYYTSTSKSFQSLIHSRFVNYTLKYYKKEGNKTWIEGLISDIENLHENTSKNAKNAEINGYITLQSVGAAQRRVSEAGTYLKSSKNSYENNGFFSFSDVMDFLYNMAFIAERCNSVQWWLDIGTKFNDTGTLTNETVENLALEYIEEARQSTVYSNVIIGEISSSYSDSLSYLSEASTLLETAQDDVDKGYTSAALFEALEALVKANLAIEIIGTDAESKLDLASDSANNNIENSRKKGIEPVLAVSYYEYAESLRNETSYDSALMYYKYSGMIAGALSFTNTTCGTGRSTYVGIPEVSSNRNLLSLAFIIVGTGVGFFIGIIAGLGIGLIVVGYVNKDGGETKKKSGKYKKHSFDKKSYNYPNNEIPRSIKDYYKKNK